VDFIVVLPFVFIFGLMAGSFMNVCIYRIPREKSVVKPRSSCPQCGRLIRWYDNIPLLSYCVLGGKCRICKAVISFRYFLVELLTGISFVLFFYYGYVNGGIPLSVIYIYFVSSLIVCTFIDFEFYIIPDSISLSGIGVGLLAGLLVPQMLGEVTHLKGLLFSFIGALVGGGVLFIIAIVAEYILKKEAMGMGDVKLMAMIGAFIGWKLVLLTLFFSSLIGSVIGIILIVAGKANMQSKIPFGPYICLGAIIALFFGNLLTDWYIGLIVNIH